MQINFNTVVLLVIAIELFLIYLRLGQKEKDV
jgi:hypothetical protein